MPETSTPPSSLSSASDSTTVRWPSGQRQIGSGVPQNLLRDRAQSTLLFSQSPNLPDLIVPGNQLVSSFCSMSWSLIAVVRMYHEGCA
ncbi:unannotated protein [freshwater metagenome]|uniref:Unannotated protein n=1 Tax=freshwater metagenome TaxID=449393 RepID=A0A6J7IH44_9ZZZZ